MSDVSTISILTHPFQVLVAVVALVHVVREGFPARLGARRRRRIHVPAVRLRSAA